MYPNDLDQKNPLKQTVWKGLPYWPCMWSWPQVQWKTSVPKSRPLGSGDQTTKSSIRSRSNLVATEGYVQGNFSWPEKIIDILIFFKVMSPNDIDIQTNVTCICMWPIDIDCPPMVWFRPHDLDYRSPYLTGSDLRGRVTGVGLTRLVLVFSSLTSMSLVWPLRVVELGYWIS